MDGENVERVAAMMGDRNTERMVMEMLIELIYL